MNRNSKKFSKVKKILRYLLYTFLAFLAIILMYITLSFIISRIKINKIEKENSNYTVLLMRSGIHVDFVFPVSNEIKDWREEFPIQNTKFKDSTFQQIAIGWGSKDFYVNTPTWDDLTIKIFLISNLGLGSSAIHIKYFNEKLPKDSKIITLKLDKTQYEKLVRYIENTLIRNKSNKSILITPKNPRVLRNNDSYYDANRTYSFLNTCNTWINNGLKACEQKACLWTPDSDGIFYQYEK